MNESRNLGTSQLSAARLLRARKTQLYFTGEGWTENPANAQPFPNEEEAVRACVTHHLRDIELVLRTPGLHPELIATSMPARHASP